jgi:hypothetical protein
MGPLKRFAFLIFFFLAINCVQAGEFVDGVEQGITPTQHAGTDITADLEEETHQSEHLSQALQRRSKRPGFRFE